MHPVPLPTVLPGTLTLARGTPADYRALETFHYLPRRPATWAGVWVVRYTPTGDTFAQHARTSDHAHHPLGVVADGSTSRRTAIPPPPSGVAAPGSTTNHLTRPQPVSRLVAVGVLSYPVPSCIARDEFLHLRGKSFGERLRFVNEHLRTISRVIVHPQFRSLGLASTLIRSMCAQSPVRFTEAMALMSQTHPLFEAGGMTRVDAATSSTDGPIYFIHDRDASPSSRG